MEVNGNRCGSETPNLFGWRPNSCDVASKQPSPEDAMPFPPTLDRHYEKYNFN
jgi:hypothetical protein